MTQKVARLFSKVNSNADKEVKDKKKSQRKRPHTPSFPAALGISFQFSIHTHKENLEFAMKVKKE